MPLTDALKLACGWRKASHSVSNGQCVEVAAGCAAVLVRDSVNPSGAVVTCAPAAWRAFINSTKAGGPDSCR